MGALAAGLACSGAGMSSTFTETTSTSWFGRIRNSFGGALIGIALIIGMVVLLFWNEGRAVQTARSLTEGAGAVVSVGADAVDVANEGKLVHVSGPVTSDLTPSDSDFGVSAKGIRLVRHVEMFQWTENAKSETKKKLGGGEETVTTYTYSQGWVDRPIDSSSFKQPDEHENPSMEIQGRSFQVPEARLGAFTLDRTVLDQIGGTEVLSLKPGQQNKIRAAYAGSKKLSLIDGGIFLGWNPSSAVVGDYRISYEVVPLDTISVVGQQRGSQFAPYQTTAGDQLLMVDRGDVPASQMFKDAESANKVLTWIIRGVGLILLAIGFGLLLSPVAVLADVVPLLGSIVRMGTGLIAFLLAVVVSTITIAVAWFYYRPLLGISILAVGAVVAAATVYYGRSRQPASSAAVATPAEQS
ncbi:TMEM43 family protein [Mesorhizobium sp. BAC0120]|uniref:TMEM43 family protein n=1 Tax=Mesorhizobium sp. BAC0120 TaxID=3090670 RepID=UPI00298CA7EA|nr:TMEM43 family protein [Mesorhizobium sp. BAC0120]